MPIIGTLNVWGKAEHFEFDAKEIIECVCVLIPMSCLSNLYIGTLHVMQVA